MRRAIRGILGPVLAAGILWLLLRGTDWGEFGAALRDVGWGWLLVAQAFSWASNFTRIRRWSYVVRAAQPAGFRQMLSATQIGLLVNFTVPARIGEMVRAHLLSRFTGQSLSRSLSMVAVDRVNDIVALLAVMTVATLAYDVNQDVEIAAGALGNSAPIDISSAVLRPATFALLGVLVASAALLVILYWRQSAVIRLTRAAFSWISISLSDRLATILKSFAEGLHVFRSGWDLARVVFWSLVTWGLGAMALSALMLAFDLPSPWAPSFLMLSLISVSISVPVAPGMVGQYHLAVVAALLLSYPGMEPAGAKAVAAVAHLSMLVPIAGLGFYCLRSEGMSLLNVIRRSQGSWPDGQRAEQVPNTTVALPTDPPRL